MACRPHVFDVVEYSSIQERLCDGYDACASLTLHALPTGPLQPRVLGQILVLGLLKGKAPLPREVHYIDDLELAYFVDSGPVKSPIMGAHHSCGFVAHGMKLSQLKIAWRF